jgi:glycosyltransferase involved in cell wall biosynthesis
MANALSRFEDNRIWIIVIENPEKVRDVLSPAIHVVNLGIKNSCSNARFPANIPSVLKVYLRQKKALTKALNSIRPDIVVSFGEFEKPILPYIKGNWRLVYIVHGLLDAQIREASSRFNKSLAKIGFWLQYRHRINAFDSIVVLSEEDKNLHWSNNPRVRVIPNPLRFETTLTSSLKEKRIISAGRLVPSKNYVSLIRAFSLIAPRFPDWGLDIFGQGEEESRLLKEIARLGLEKRVQLKGFCPNLQREMATASIFTHSSLWESFGMVLVEAMNCGLPVVAYDCPTGPRSIIANGENGYLVPLGDEQTFADCLSRLIEDGDLRARMGHQARQASNRYKLDSITACWMNLFEELMTEK